MDKPQRLPWLGIGLITLGVVLILKQVGVFRFYWHDIFWGLVFVGGVVLIVRGFMNQGRGVFLGVCAAAIAGYRLLTMYSEFYIPSSLILPSLLVLSGIGILFVYVARPRHWHLLVPSVVLMGLGGMIILADEGYFNRWELIDFLRVWWPAFLVLFGTALLLNQGRNHRP